MNDALTQIQPYIAQLNNGLQSLWLVLQPLVAQGTPWLDQYPWQSLMAIIGSLTVLSLLFIICTNWLLRLIIASLFAASGTAGVYTLILIGHLFLAPR